MLLLLLVWLCGFIGRWRRIVVVLVVVESVWVWYLVVVVLYHHGRRYNIIIILLRFRTHRTSGTGTGTRMTPRQHVCCGRVILVVVVTNGDEYDDCDRYCDRTQVVMSWNTTSTTSTTTIFTTVYE